MDIQEIKHKLINNVITYGQAWDLIKQLPKPWKRKDWQVKRDKLIKDYCEQCEAKNVTMVIQHFVHPAEFSDISDELLYDLIESNSWAQALKNEPIFISDKEVEEFIAENVTKRLACPKCKRLSFQERKTFEKRFKCYSCHTLFDIPIEINYASVFKCRIEKINVKDHLASIKSIARDRFIRKKMFEENKEQLGKMALLKNIRQHEEYCSLDNTVTFCKNCANKMDYSNRLLCYGCKQNYFDYGLYEVCYECHQKGIQVQNPFLLKLHDLNGGLGFNQFYMGRRLRVPRSFNRTSE